MLTWRRAQGHRELLLDGAPVGRSDAGSFRERVTADLPDGRWSFRRVSGGHIVGTGPAGDKGPRLVAHRRTRWGWHWEVLTPVARYDVRSGAVRSRCRVLRDGRRIGTAERRWFSTARFVLHVPSDVPLPDQVFLLWVAEASARRRDSLLDAVSDFASV